MPTRVATSKSFRNRLSRTRRAGLAAARLQDALVFNIGPPWMGFSPDLSTSLASLAHAAVGTQGIISRNGILTTDSGWARVENAATPTLPLGADNLGAASTQATDPQPISMLGEVILQHLAQLRTAFAFTTKTASTPNGYLWHVDTLGDWVNVPFSATAPFSGGVESVASRSAIFDWASYPFGGSLLGGLAPGMVVFTNYDDEVYAWDIGAGGALPGAYGSAFGITVGSGKFFAKSVELFDDRLVFLNTREGSPIQKFPRRFRFSHPGASPFPDMTGENAGFIEFDEFLGAGLRALKLGDVCALYFEDGIAVAQRTFIAKRPFAKKYISKQRGLLGPQAVTRVTNDAHIGAFTDGFFFFTANGEWRELGTQAIDQAQQASRWTREFFTQLDITNRKNISVSFDNIARIVRIAFPRVDGPGQGENDTVWVYDLRTDTMWVDADYEATTWGETERQTSPGLTWATTGSTTWAQIQGQWAGHSPILNLEQPMHGDTNGMVFGHEISLTQRDGVDVPWSFVSHLNNLGDARLEKLADQLDIEFITLDMATSITLSLLNERGDTESQTIDMQQGVAGRLIRDYVNFRLSGTHLGFRLDGSGPFKIHSVGLKLASPISSGKRQT